MEQDQSANASQEKIDFFLISAHELRTSLSAMKWVLKMLCDGDYGNLTPEQHAAITQATQANDRMVALLNDTMTAIKNDTVLTYAKKAIQFDALIAEITAEFKNEATQKSITIAYHPSAAPITIMGDETRMRSAIHNILENAIKYSNSETEIVVTLSDQGNKALLSVQDHGAGIPEDKKQHLFEKFYRAENTAQAGTGLGLYSTKHVIEQHGGTIAIESEEHKGTTVLVTLPIAQ
jgi:two-component system phosphate regulon sensor histidine kinase PhoR